MDLTALGWDEFFAAAFAPHAALGREPARVTLELKGFVEVTGAAGARLGECTGKFARAAGAKSDFPSIGDWVAVTPRAGDATRADLHAVLPRRTKFSRQSAGEEAAVEQVVAANIDTVFLVAGLDANFNLRRLERYLAAARASGAQPVVLLNKADLCPDSAALQAEAVRAAGPEVPVLVVSAHTRRGLKALTPWLAPGRTVALLGSSGVGKSTLINRLLRDDVQPTQAVRATDSKGRHTTSQRELIVAPAGFLLIDTPGMRELQPWRAGTAALADTFADVAALSLRCRFTSCTHADHTPGCAIATALADGALDPERWANFLKLRREQTVAATRGSSRLTRAAKADVKKTHKAHRDHYRLAREA